MTTEPDSDYSKSVAAQKANVDKLLRVVEHLAKAMEREPSVSAKLREHTGDEDDAA